MHRRTSKRLRLIAAIFGIIICPLVLLALSTRPKVQTLTLMDGTKVHFLGISEGTNHWNPKTPVLNRAISKVPHLGSIVIPHLPNPAGSQPAMAILSQSGTVLWFHLEKAPQFSQRLFFRCLDKSGEQVVGIGILDFHPGTNATPVWLQYDDVNGAARIQSVEIYLGDIPIPRFRVGEFKVPKGEQLDG